MNPGEVVRWKKPQSDAEQRERFVVVENNGGRLLLQFICDLPIPPTYVYAAADLEVVSCG